MQLLQLKSFPIEQEALDAVEQRLMDWCATLTFPVRLLAFSRACDLQPASARLVAQQRDLAGLARAVAPLLATIDRRLAGDRAADPAAAVADLPADDLGLLLDLCAHAPDVQHLLLGQRGGDAALPQWQLLADALASVLWRLPWLKDQVRFYEELQRRHLRSATYILITWEPPEVSQATLVATLQQATGRPVTVLAQLPPAITATYLPQADHLRPERFDAPYLALGMSYEVQGTFDATSLHTLLAAPYDVALAIDIATFSRDRAQRVAELAYNSTRLLAQDTRVLDTRAASVQASARRTLAELGQQSLHTVELVVMVSGATATEVQTHFTATSTALGTQLRWMQPPWHQGRLLQYFSTRPRPEIDVPHRPRTMLSHGVACLAGVVGYHRASSTAGAFWGIDVRHQAGLFVDLFAGNQAGHIALLGATGYGKTFFLNLYTLRSAVGQGHRVIGIDDFDNGPRMAQAAGGGGYCYILGMDTPINILDVVYDADAEGGWLPNQVQHAIGQLSLLLGTPGTTPDGRDRLVPRAFSSEEAGVLDRALTRLYSAVSPSVLLDQMPLLSDLVGLLDARREAEAQQLARQLRLKLFGSDDPDEGELTTVGRCFNAHTQVDWRFGADITSYNTASVPQLYRPFFYLQIIGAVLRYMRDPRRDRRRKTILAIDEFGYLTQIEALARLAATITKVARKYGIGLVVVDQNPQTFLDSETGRSIFENCAAKVAFRLDEAPARQLAGALRGVREEHIAALTRFAPGQCLAVVRNDVYVLNVEPSPRELRALAGS